MASPGRTEEYQEDSLFTGLNLIPEHPKCGSILVTSKRDVRLKKNARCFTNMQCVCTEMYDLYVRLFILSVHQSVGCL